MEATALLGFVFISFIGIATPGPDVCLAISNGSRHGIRRAAIGIAGVAVSDLLIMAAVALGLGAMLEASQLFFLAAKLLGIFYLAYLGVKLIRVQAMPFSDIATDIADRGEWGIKLFKRSFFVAFTNIKVWLFFAAFLPQFINADLDQIPQYMMLALVFETLNLSILMGYAMLGAAAMQVFNGNTAVWVDRASGAVLLLLAVSLAFLERGIVPG